MAAKFGVPVCPHAGGVGLCEYVQHLAIFDYIAVSGSLEERVVEYVDHLHEHFVDPVSSGTVATSPRPRRATASRCGRNRWSDTPSPSGEAWTPPRPRGVRAMSGRLADKVSLITGAGSGIGRASALLFAAEGSRVAVADIDVAAAQETVRLITAAGGVATDYRVDVTDPDDGERSPSRRRAASARSTCSSTTRASPGIGLLHETSVELWDRVMAVNVRGVFLVARAVLPHMIAAGRGSIINMSSTIAEIGLANRASYAASKGAVLP